MLTLLTTQAKARLPILLLAVMASLAAVSCTKKKASSVKVTADFLHVRGQLLLPGGSPGVDAKVYVSGLADNVGESDDSGAFRFTLSESEIAALHLAESESHGSLRDETFEVIVETADESYVAAIGPISYSTRGTLDVGEVSLVRPATLNGRVDVLQSDGSYKPAGDVKVVSGRSEAKTTADGYFSLTKLVPGRRALIFSGSGIALQKKEYELTSEQILTLDQPIYVFPDGLVAGSLRTLDAESADSLIAAGHPYRR